jgi:inorganic pyrophosphatase
MNIWHDISAGDNVPENVNVVVEIPKGSQNKYEFDKDTQLFKLDRVLFSPMHYPGDYGLIPQTLGGDGDPLDGLVIVNYPTYPGVLISARPIGILLMEDNGEPDEKILCVPQDDIRMEDMGSIADVQSAIQKEIAHFFQVYKELEGKKVVISGWEDVDEAKKVIVEGVERYKKEMGK